MPACSYLSNNPVTSLGAYSFAASNMQQTLIVDLSNTSITAMRVDTLGNCTALYLLLDLSDNGIDTLEPGALAGFSGEWMNVILNNCRITNITGACTRGSGHVSHHDCRCELSYVWDCASRGIVQ